MFSNTQSVKNLVRPAPYSLRVECYVPQLKQGSHITKVRRRPIDQHRSTLLDVSKRVQYRFDRTEYGIRLPNTELIMASTLGSLGVTYQRLERARVASSNHKRGKRYVIQAKDQGRLGLEDRRISYRTVRLVSDSWLREYVESTREEGSRVNRYKNAIGRISMWEFKFPELGGGFFPEKIIAKQAGISLEEVLDEIDKRSSSPED